jgi:ATP-binding cassette subfamily B protein
MHMGWWAYLRYDEQRGRPRADRAFLGRVARWVRPYLRQVAVMLVLLVAIALIELVPPLIYGAMINDLSNGTLTLPRLNLQALGLLVVPVASSLLGVAQRRFSSQIGEGVIFDLRVAMYRHMQRMGLRFFTATKTGDIISRFDNDVVGAQSAVTGTVPNLLTNVLTLVTTLAIMLTLEWRLTLLAVVALPLFLLPTRRIGRRLRQLRREAADHDANMSSQLQETLNVSGALLVRTFGRGTDEVERFATAAAAVRDIGVRRAVIGRWFFFGLGIAAAIGTALMYWVGGYLVLTAGMSPGIIVTFAAYIGRLYGPITGLSTLQVEFATSMVSFERVFEYLDQPIEIVERPDALDLATIDGDLAFEDVWFSYQAVPPTLDGAALAEPLPMTSATPAPAGWPVAAAVDAGGVGDEGDTGDTEAVDDGDDEARPVARGRTWTLAEVTFHARPGEIVALVGPSGAGKTTIGYLLSRLYDPTRGRVRLDGHDLRDLTLASIARGVGVVTQETFLFHDTIRANLRFARPEATDAEVAAACRAANVDALVSALPEGYDTVVGERGYRLSGGEKQRLALARVILKDPSLLLLDEATSHLDSQNESLIQEALDRVMRGRTSVVIAHRLSTILAADQILVLDEGRVVERGTHGDLLAAGGLYAELFETQFRAGEPAAPASAA